ncbi:MAG: LytTR family transcriptional regulator DNA-binding domain-containing protein [Bacillota bacterium]
MEDMKTMKLIHGKVCVKHGNERLFIPKRNIIMFVKNGRKTDIHTIDGDVFSINASLNSIEKKLDNRHFFRAHQSYIINLMLIQKVVSTELETFVVMEHTKEKALITKQNERKLYDHIEVL